jgi:hypothetical protein
MKEGSIWGQNVKENPKSFSLSFEVKASTAFFKGLFTKTFAFGQIKLQL